MELKSDEDRELIADFILDYPNDNNGIALANSTKKGYISNLVYLSRYLEHKKCFREMDNQDIVYGYLNSLRVPFHEDVDQKWINTHNKRAGCYLKFFK